MSATNPEVLPYTASTGFVSVSSLRGSLLDLALILPTYDEAENIPLVIARLTEALQGLAWEAIFVDDDSPDGTAEIIASYARNDPRIRLLHRVGRRGLASACVEGMMSTTASVVAVMDADLQHDETILPLMLSRLHRESLDIVVGTRNAGGGSMGDFGRPRVLLSRLGQRISHAVCRCQLTDPMSGFFMLRRSFLREVVHDLQNEGFKILVDILSSSRRPVALAEVGYTFRSRRHGQSKLNVVVTLEYFFLVVNKLLGGIIPVQIALFSLVGSLGLLTHFLALLFLTRICHVSFVTAQWTATSVAMVENFVLNNSITFRNRSLGGAHLLPGMLRFVVACSFGAWANVLVAHALRQSGVETYLAGFAGILLGSVWNLSISSVFTWGIQHRHAPEEGDSIALTTGRGISH